MNEFADTAKKIIAAMERATSCKIVPYHWTLSNDDGSEKVTFFFNGNVTTYTYERVRKFLGIAMNRETVVLSSDDPNRCLNHWYMLGDALGDNMYRLMEKV